jgi:putative FmdB family regulatory protein
MPIYEYECLDCGERFDLLRRMVDADAPTACPICRVAKSKRRVSGGNFELRGGGWFKDGYHK